MEHYKLYQRGTKDVIVEYNQESHDAPYIVRMYSGDTIIHKMRTDTKQGAARIAQQWLNCK